jgi:hypothetical protein
VPQQNSRLVYTFKLVLTELLGIKFELCSDADEFLAHDGPKFSYSFHPLDDELFIASKQFLFETGLKDQDIHVTEWNNIKIFFATFKQSCLPFDLFAASFYMVSRYEEYLPSIHDSHHRFEAHQSLAYTNGFLQKPIVNIWAYLLRDILKNKFPQLLFRERHYKYITSIDIDNAFAYKEKGFMRTIGGNLRSLSKLDFKEISLRTRVLTAMQKDPYDTYDFQLAIQQKYALKPLYFFLFAQYGLNDKNVPVTNKNFQELIKSISDNSEVGIHPSYGSNFNKKKLPSEIMHLSKVLNREITKSRQHFLKLTFPETYSYLIELGITDDYTMGFASEIGFRAGICNTFNFYDLDLETETKLRIHPFQIMDASLRFYMNINVDDAMASIKPLIDEVKKVDGTFMSLWHNESLSNINPWEGWRNVYELMVMEAVENSESV